MCLTILPKKIHDIDAEGGIATEGESRSLSVAANPEDKGETRYFLSLRT